MSGRWTTPEDVRAKVRRRWDDGSLLQAHAAGAPFPVVDVALRGPRPNELGDDLDAVRQWVSRLEDASANGHRYTLTWTTIGGRQVGRNHIPARASVSSFDQAWALLGVTAQVKRFAQIEALVAGESGPRAWVVAHPHQALALADEWPQILSAYAWLDAHRGSGAYLRQISTPGVDTKLAERHRPTLAALLGVASSAPAFLADLGLRAKPELLRLRPSPTLGLPQPLTELGVRSDELARLTLRPKRVLVCENEITYLSVPVPDDGAVIWGKGFEVDRVGRLPWLADVDVTYWGDLDTHGFAILDRLRAWLPQTRSVLMDRGTLLAHRDRWGREDRPATSRLTRLTDAEHELYDELVGDVLGERVRLEQERIDWSWASVRLLP